LVQYIRKGAIDYSLYGQPFRFFPGENTGDRKALFTPNGFDRDECNLIVQHLGKGAVFLDIGSNIGAYTFNIAARRRDARIIAFEPMPRVYLKLSYNIKINELHDRVIAFNLALSDRKGEVNFNSELESLVLGEGDIMVQTDTLLNVLSKQNITEIGAMKIDVEGAEDSVLRPFFENADKGFWPRLIIIEHAFPEQWNWDCISFLGKNGYDQIWRGSLNTVYQYNGG
jgi:FkbM family methyltransferase